VGSDGHPEEGTSRGQVYIWPLLGEVLEGRERCWDLLDLVDHDQGSRRFDGRVRRDLEPAENALGFEITLEDRCGGPVALQIDVGDMLVLGAAELLQ
jgi:hypothetical protein